MTRRKDEAADIAAREAGLRAQGVPPEMINAPARTDMPRAAFRAYERDADLLGALPPGIRQAADEIAILAYSTNRTPTRTARIAAYLALLVSEVPRSVLDDFMERRQHELAGGSVEPVGSLVAATNAILAAARRQEEQIAVQERDYAEMQSAATVPLDTVLDEATIRAVCEARAAERRETKQCLRCTARLLPSDPDICAKCDEHAERRLLAAKADLGDFPAHTAVGPDEDAEGRAALARMFPERYGPHGLFPQVADDEDEPGHGYWEAGDI